VSTAAIEGNVQADILVVEYSDMECPFCVRQYAETKLRKSLIDQYGDKVAFAFKNNRGVNHSGTEAKAIGALCAKKL
jgi:protein-disulfide isomerase